MPLDLHHFPSRLRHAGWPRPRGVEALSPWRVVLLALHPSLGTSTRCVLWWRARASAIFTESSSCLRKDRSWRSRRRFAAPPASPAIDMASLQSMQRRTTRALRSPLNLRALVVVVVQMIEETACLARRVPTCNKLKGNKKCCKRLRASETLPAATDPWCLTSSSTNPCTRKKERRQTILNPHNPSTLRY